MRVFHVSLADKLPEDEWPDFFAAWEDPVIAVFRTCEEGYYAVIFLNIMDEPQWIVVDEEGVEPDEAYEVRVINSCS